MKHASLVLFTFSSFLLLAQDHPSCDNSRYIDDVFTAIDSTVGVYYGEGVTISGDTIDLFMDIYEPAGDQIEERPVLLLAFGGSFIAGEREDLAWLCRRYAQKGFIAATIDYRLYDLPLFPLPSAQEMEIVVTKSIADFKGAIRYLRSEIDNGNPYKLDKDLFFVGGISAGSIAAAHTAMLDETDNYSQQIQDIIDAEGGLEGTVNDLPYSSEVQGYVNFSGGLNDSKWIDATDPPFISVHEDGDPTVPYAGGFANIFGFDIIYLEGSKLLMEVADSLNITNHLKTFESNQHVGYFFDDDETTEVIDLTSSFLHDIICEDDLFSSTENLELIPSLALSPNPTSGTIYIQASNLVAETIIVYNAIGERIFSTPFNRKIDLSHLKRGIYYVTVADKNNHQTRMEKLIKL